MHTVVLHYFRGWKHLVTHEVVKVACALASVDSHQGPVREAVERQSGALHQQLGGQLGDLDAVDVDGGGGDEYRPRLASRGVF